MGQLLILLHNVPGAGGVLKNTHMVPCGPPLEEIHRVKDKHSDGLLHGAEPHLGHHQSSLDPSLTGLVICFPKSGDFRTNMRRRQGLLLGQGKIDSMKKSLPKGKR